MKITKSGFYCLAELSDLGEKIEIEKNLEVSMYDNTNSSVDIYVGENSKLDFFSLFDGDVNESDTIAVRIYQGEENSQVIIRSLIISKDNNKIDTQVLSHISSHKSKSDVKILSIIGENGDVSLDGIIKIDRGVKDVEGYLEEENLFLGSKGKVKGIPTLLVESDDVKASHSCKMERISDEKLFYLRSRGIGKQSAIDMMIDSYISDLFSGLERMNKDFFAQVFENILEKLRA